MNKTVEEVVDVIDDVVRNYMSWQEVEEESTNECASVDQVNAINKLINDRDASNCPNVPCDGCDEYDENENFHVNYIGNSGFGSRVNAQKNVGNRNYHNHRSYDNYNQNSGYWNEVTQGFHGNHNNFGCNDQSYDQEYGDHNQGYGAMREQGLRVEKAHRQHLNLPYPDYYYDNPVGNNPPPNQQPGNSASSSSGGGQAENGEQQEGNSSLMDISDPNPHPTPIIIDISSDEEEEGEFVQVESEPESPELMEESNDSNFNPSSDKQSTEKRDDVRKD
ncbi:homeobox protein 2-like [Chenopodium quinoa]|uniref:homeobox protein 2-like n=1 Tax=Chenopodium quinoa TaxID=63459 RepID=UPI000B76EEF9|nr:homeobox protein 2-like [Chenopodium quinoa]